MAGKQRRRTTELWTGHILDVVLEQSKQTQDGASKTILKKIRARQCLGSFRHSLDI